MLHYTISMIVRIVQDIDTQLTSLDASTYSSYFFFFRFFFFFPFCFTFPEEIAIIALALLNSFHIKVRNGTQLVRASLLVRPRSQSNVGDMVGIPRVPNGIIPFVRRRKNAKRRGPLARVRTLVHDKRFWMETYRLFGDRISTTKSWPDYLGKRIETSSIERRVLSSIFILSNLRTLNFFCFVRRVYEYLIDLVLFTNRFFFVEKFLISRNILNHNQNYFFSITPLT